MIALACALIAFYVSNIPIYLSIAADSRFRPRFGIGAFVRPRPRPFPKASGKAGGRVHPALFPILRRLIPRVRFVGVSLRGALNAGDAMRTALICGGIEALAASLAAACPNAPIYMEVTPDFSDGKTDIALRCMISLRIGQIIVSAMLGMTDYIKGRMQKWKLKIIPFGT